MSIEHNKAVVRQWLRLWNIGDHLGLGDLYSDESFDWRISGLSPVSRKYAKADIVEMMRKTFSTPMREKLHLTVKHLTAEDDRVAMEAEGRGIYASGDVFHNFYHILFTIREGKVVRGRAYLDTWTAANSPLQARLNELQSNGWDMLSRSKDKDRSA
jgi:ketosteroid isomerase-like protein